MNEFSKIKQSTLLIGDIFVLYASLTITLWLRYGHLFYSVLITSHIQPFTIIFAVWLTVFYISGLYDLKTLKNSLEFQKGFLYALIFNIVIGALFFYLLPSFKITPKTNLILFFISQIYNFILGAAGATNKILLVGSNKIAKELAEHIEDNHQLGYQIKYWMHDGLKDKEFNHLAQIILANGINTIVIPAHLKKDYESAKMIYKTLVLGIEVLDMSALYEIIFKKVPLAELEEVWFLENLTKKHKIYDLIYRPIEYIAAVILSVVFLPFFIIIAALIKLTSPGQAIFKQTRVGKEELKFTIYKFRTMVQDAEKDGPRWANYDDKRATPIGRILRKTHLDEIPQLINILKGELSFIGPRPERPEFVEKLRTEVPYYELRLLVKPGITGWAQINYKYGASTEETYEKVQYDIYYIKNNSLFLDISILLKTIKFLISNHR
ncbi:MAG: Sugar transferase [Parcubacteria group bacterium Athens0714_26]|nr:MAG: Sugar transferase [Parcubacteria group bacterium Athens0714_26]